MGLLLLGSYYLCSTTFSITALSIRTFSIMAYSQYSVKMTLGINDIQQNGTQQTSGEYYYAECRDYKNVMLSVIMLNVVAPLS
jgi:hypothetical protein